MRKTILTVLVLLSMSGSAAAQVVAGQGLTIGNPPTPPVGSTVRIKGIDETGGNGPLFLDPDGDLLKRLLVKGDLPASIAYEDEDNVFDLTNLFKGQATFTLGIIAPSIRSSVTPFSIRNTANTLDMVTVGDILFSVNAPSRLLGEVIVGSPEFAKGLEVTGIIVGRDTLNITNASHLSGTLFVGLDATFNNNILVPQTRKKFWANFHGPLLDRFAFQSNAAAGNTYVTAMPSGAATEAAFAVSNSSNPVANQPFASLSIDATQSAVTTGAAGNITILPMGFMYGATKTAQMDNLGWKFYSKVGVSGIYSLTSPFTVYATDTVTPLMELYDPGRNVIRNSGNDTVWEYHGLGNPSGARIWRAGNVGGNFRVDAGNDAASTWNNLFRASMTAGVPDGIFWGDGVRDVTPNKSYQTNLGRLTNKYLGLHAAELFVETLVAHETMATIGGRILVGPTTQLTTELTDTATSIQTKHNNLQNGDVVYLEGVGGAPTAAQVEFIRINGSAQSSQSGTLAFRSGSQSAQMPANFPAHQAGDLIIVEQHRTSSSVLLPVPPAGWTTVCSKNTVYMMFITAKIATSSAEPVGTWTNQGEYTNIHIWRSGNANPMPLPTNCVIGAGPSTGSVNAWPMTYPALTLARPGSSWVARFGGRATQSVPPGYVSVANDFFGSESSRSSGAMTTVTADTVTGVGSPGNWSAASIEILPPVGTGGPWNYAVTRNLDGSGANAWIAGDAVFNTGQTGNGFIDIYSTRGVRSGTEIGPTIAGNVRQSGTYNDWETRWGVGNLSGLYDYGASNTYGAAFGDPNGVWISADATKGFRGMNNTTQKLIIHPTGYIMLGNEAAGQYNVYLDDDEIASRTGTVNRTRITAASIINYDPTGVQRTALTADGLYVYENTGVYAAAQVLQTYSRFGYQIAPHNNIYLDHTTGRMTFYSATVQRIVIEPSNAAIKFYDTTGSNVAVEVSSTYSTFGYASPGFGNTHITSSGSLNIRSGTSNRIVLDPSNGAMTFYDPDGAQRHQIRSDIVQFGNVDAGARLTYTPANQGTLSFYDGYSKEWMQIDRRSGLLLGDWYTTGMPYVQIVPEAEMWFCATTKGCPLVLQGSTGNIISSGNIILSAGGNITSNSNFTLGNNIGLVFESWAGNTPSAARSVVFKQAGVDKSFFGQDASGALRIRSLAVGGGTGIRLAVGNTGPNPVDEAGLFMTREPWAGGVMSNYVYQNITDNPGVAQPMQVRLAPLYTNVNAGWESTLGMPEPSSQWTNIHGGTFWNGTQPGLSRAIMIKDSHGINVCQINFAGGIAVSTNCSATQ